MSYVATTINNVQVDFGLGIAAPTVTFLQGADMSIPSLQDTFRQIEETDEGVSSPFKQVISASGNEDFSDDGTVTNALTVTVLDPFKMQFQAGPIPFKTSTGNLLGKFIDSPGAIVQINNAVGSLNQNSEAIEYSSFQNGIWLDATNGSSGTDYPTGTPASPVNNAVDAKTIADTRGFDKVFVLGDYTFTTGDDISGMTIEGQNPVKSTVTIDVGASANKVELFECHAIGTLDGASTARECLITNLNYINGYLHNCILSPGVISLGGGTTAYLIDCTSGLPGLGTPTIDMGGSGQPLAVRNYNGGIKLINKTGSDNVSIDLGSGQAVLDSATVTGGTIVVRGDGKLVDENGNHLLSGTWNGGVTIVNETTSVLHQHTLDSIGNAVLDAIA